MDKFVRIDKALKSFYTFVIKLASRDDALYYLAFFSFIESSFFPIPPYVMIVPMVLARPEQAWKIAAVATISSVMGGYLGYFIGYFLFDRVAEPVLAFYGYMDHFGQIQEAFQRYGSGVILLGGLTPLPFKVVAVLCGLFKMNLIEFGLVSFIARAIRFYAVSWLLLKYGEGMKTYVKQNLKRISFVVLVLLVACVIFFPYLEI
ncbi:MAG: YqaA family protein [Alphaproteobacteria bacterium]